MKRPRRLVVPTGLRSLRTGLIAGAVFGLFAPFVGLFLGLQASPGLGTAFMAPFVALSVLTGVPFGEMSAGLRWVALALSVLTGAALGAILQRVIRPRKRDDRV